MTSSAALLVIEDVFIKRQAVVQLIIELDVAYSSIETLALYTCFVRRWIHGEGFGRACLGSLG
jgi:hypothetical protein